MISKSVKIRFDESNKGYYVWVAYTVKTDGSRQLEMYCWGAYEHAMNYYAMFVKEWTNSAGAWSAKFKDNKETREVFKDCDFVQLKELLFMPEEES